VDLAMVAAIGARGVEVVLVWPTSERDLRDGFIEECRQYDLSFGTYGIRLHRCAVDAHALRRLVRAELRRGIRSGPAQR